MMFQPNSATPHNYPIGNFKNSSSSFSFSDSTTGKESTGINITKCMMNGDNSRKAARDTNFHNKSFSNLTDSSSS